MGKKILDIFKVLILAYFITGLLLLVAAFMMYKLKLSQSQVRIFIMVIYGITTIVAGLVYGKLKRGRRALNGAFIGMMYFLVLTLVSMIINKGFYDDMKKAVISLIICVTGGVLGGIMS